MTSRRKDVLSTMLDGSVEESAYLFRAGAGSLDHSERPVEVARQRNSIFMVRANVCDEHDHHTGGKCKPKGSCGPSAGSPVESGCEQGSGDQRHRKLVDSGEQERREESDKDGASRAPGGDHQIEAGQIASVRAKPVELVVTEEAAAKEPDQQHGHADLNGL